MQYLLKKLKHSGKPAVFRTSESCRKAQMEHRLKYIQGKEEDSKFPEIKSIMKTYSTKMPENEAFNRLILYGSLKTRFRIYRR